MAGPFNLRVFGYRGMVQVRQRLVKQYSADSVFVLEEPYLWSQLLPVLASGAAVESAVIAAPDLTEILRIEVPDGQQIRYEINTGGPTGTLHRNAGNLSPRLAGFDNFQFQAGWTISACDAAFYL